MVGNTTGSVSDLLTTSGCICILYPHRQLSQVKWTHSCREIHYYIQTFSNSMNTSTTNV